MPNDFDDSCHLLLVSFLCVLENIATGACNLSSRQTRHKEKEISVVRVGDT